MSYLIRSSLLDYLTTRSDYPLNLPPYYRGELLHGYLNRVALINNMPGVDYMLRHLVDRDKADVRSTVYSYDSFGAAASIIQVDSMAMSDLILSGTIFSGEVPLEDKFSTALRTYRWNLPIGNANSITGQNKAMLRELRICPECRREEGEEWHFHTDLQMPLVKICPEHNCALHQYTGRPYMEHFDESFKPYDITIEDEELSYFIISFFNLALACSYTEIRNVVLRAMVKGGIDFLDTSTQSYPDAGALRSILPSPYDFYHSSYFRFPEYKAFPLMTYLFEDARSFIYELGSVPSWKDEFMAAICGRYELVSDYNETIVTLKCNTCGNTFISTPKGILIGLGCPHCNKKISERELYDRMVETHSHNCHMPLVPTDGNLFTVNYIDKKTQAKGSAPARRYFNEDYDVSALMTSLKKETEATGRYDLLGYEPSPTGYYVRLHLRHHRCGGDFWVNRNEFLIASYCRYCGKEKDQKLAFKEKLHKNDPSFNIVGQYSYNYVEVTNGDITLTGQPVAVLHSLERYLRGDDPIKKVSPKDENLYRRVEYLFKERKGKLISTKELYALGPRERVHGCLRTMRAGNKIKLVTNGYYCNVSDSFSIIELQNEFYVKNGENGFPVCDSALVYIGEQRKTDKPAFMLKNRAKGTKYGRKDLDEPNLFDIPDSLKDNCNFNAMIFVGSVFHQNCFSTKSKRGKDERVLALLEYAITHGTSIEEIRRTASAFNEKTARKVEKLLKEYSDGKDDI